MKKVGVVDKVRAQIPEEVAALLADPPILRGESREQYLVQLVAIAQAINAKDVIHWLWASDVAYHTWEIHRAQKIKLQLILLHQTQIVEELLSSTFDPANSDLQPLYIIFDARNEARRWATDSEFAKKIDERLAIRGHDSASILAKAYARCAGELHAIDKRISGLELRRMATLREISHRDEIRAKQLERKSLEIIDGDFSEAAE
jgi:hypothetical protein